MIRTLWWENGRLFIIDQRKLPGKEHVLELKNARDVWNAIRNLSIRGAPAIGCVAAYGVALAALNTRAKTGKTFVSSLLRDIEYLSTSRPTAYNLFFALGRMENVLRSAGTVTTFELQAMLVAEAEAIYREDMECCRRIGASGETLIRSGMNIITHCNAGGLATSGYGTALAVFYEAVRRGKRFHVFVDETRPVFQGARLTAWELKKAGIPYTLVCDNMAGFLMQQGRIDLAITGADRIAANGDTANKIGTYSLAVLARYHGIDFYVAAPFSTFDNGIRNGREINIEERDAAEVRKAGAKKIAPEDAPVYNPAFDVTPVKLITGFITENGIIKRPAAPGRK